MQKTPSNKLFAVIAAVGATGALGLGLFLIGANMSSTEFLMTHDPMFMASVVFGVFAMVWLCRMMLDAFWDILFELPERLDAFRHR